jgi:hypothetical protein
MSSEPAPRPAGPYVEAALALWQAGWVGVLPLPERSKTPPPEGFTGAGGVYPSRADVQSWVDDGRPGANVAIRLPGTVIGIDVDAYANKLGGTTHKLAVEKYGPLPPTWRSTSREQSVSGIYLYTVPDGLAWPGELGRDVEIIQHRHRYMVAPPSVHPSGARYRWIRPDGATSLTPPRPAELAALPGAWVEALGVQGVRGGTVRTELDDAAVGAWLDAVTAGRGDGLCRATRDALGTAVGELDGARHPAALRGCLRLVRLAAEGHTGAADALNAVRAAFLTACADPSRGTVRPPGHAEHEFAVMLRGAIEVVAGTPTAPLDPCIYPLAGILDPGPTTNELRADAARQDVPPPPREWPPAAPAGVPAAAVSPEPVADAGEAYSRWYAGAVAQQAERLRIGHDAREVVEAERAAASWQAPDGMRLDELLALPREVEPYTIERLLPADGNVVVTAQYKAGKTTLVANLARSLVDGVPFLGAFAVNARRRVALWNFEVGRGQFAAWLADLGIVEPGAVWVENLRGLTMPLTSPLARQYAIDSLLAHGTEVWIVDPFARSYTGESENDNSAVARYLDQLDDVKAAAGVRELVVVAHTGRADQSAGAERARGATRLDDWPDVRWLLVRDHESGLRYFRADGRDVEVGEGQLSYDGNRRLSFDAATNRRTDSTGELQRTILHAIDTTPGIGSRALRAFCREALGSASSQRVTDAIAALESQGMVRTEQKAANATVEHYLGGRVQNG